MTVATVRLWGKDIGAVAIHDIGDFARFEYDPTFLSSGINLAPMMMPLRPDVFTFKGLARESFHGLPGMLADSLPDKYGNAVIDAWLASEGRLPTSFDAVERLCYTGTRGMGALEFIPAKGPTSGRSTSINIDSLVGLAGEVLANRNSLNVSFADPDKAAALREILLVGTSAGGARAKAVIAWNPETNEVRSGQVEAETGFGYWLIKFDGVSGNGDKDLTDPKGYGAVEYAYSLMAKRAGISVSDTRLMEENGRRHFMTRRFDRLDGGEKLHMQSLAAIMHLDFNQPRANSYEQAFMAIRSLELGAGGAEEQFRRMVFNIVARNQDDHVKNIAFLMDKSGAWRLSPAYDVTWSYNPSGSWTSKHQMSVNGKWDDFSVDDLKACAKVGSLKRGSAETIFEEVREAVRQWPTIADEVGVDEKFRDVIQSTLRLDLPTI